MPNILSFYLNFKALRRKNVALHFTGKALTGLIHTKAYFCTNQLIQNEEKT
jgi:hypothetical protein